MKRNGLIAFLFVLHALAGNLNASPLAAFRLQTEDLNGNPINVIHPSADFRLTAYVEDIRNPAAQVPGLWAAFLNVAYNPNLVSIPANPNPNPSDINGYSDLNIVFGPYFAHGLLTGNLDSPGVILGAGSSSLSLVPSGAAPIVLWTVNARAIGLGTVQFLPSFDSAQTPGDPLPIDHESLFLDPPFALSADQIQFVGTTLTIVVPEPSSFILTAFGLIGCLASGRPARSPLGKRLASMRLDRQWASAESAPSVAGTSPRSCAGSVLAWRGMLRARG